MEAPLVNRIAKSRLVTIDAGKLYPKNIHFFDLKAFLFKELILKEADFRAALDAFDWIGLKDKHLFIYCSSDAIIPLWAYMLVASKAQGHAISVRSGNQQAMYAELIIATVKKQYPADTIANGKFVIKGCSEYDLSPRVYSDITAYLVGHDARSIMFGEPCSTVPIYKKKK